MKRPYIIPLSICALVLIGFLVFNQFIAKSYDGDSFSDSIEESQRDALFIGFYQPNKDSLSFKHSKIKTPLAWAEYGWKTESGLFSTQKDVSKGQMNFIIQDTGACGQPDYIYSIKNDSKALNCVTSLGSVSRVWTYDDSITVYVKQGSDDLGWQKEVVTDTIIFIRQDGKP